MEPVADAFNERQRTGQRRQEEITLGPQPGVQIGDVHGDRAVGEVDDARAEVGQYDAEGDGGDERPLGDPVAGHESLAEVVGGEDRDERDGDKGGDDRLGGGRRRHAAERQLAGGVTSIGSPVRPLRMLTHSPSVYCWMPIW